MKPLSNAEPMALSATFPLIDTHCHIHEPSYPDAAGAIAEARQAGVARMVCVGTDLASSREAAAFAASNDGVFASLGVHPHEASSTQQGVSDAFQALVDGHKGDSASKIIAIGEIGLDYHYSHSPREAQLPLLEEQLQFATDHKLPVIFHVRESFGDFWPVLDNFPGTRGVLHSFTDTAATLEKALGKGLFIGVNGISTFTKDPAQRAMFAQIPLDKLLLETDAPFLTPPPFRGKINRPAYVRLVASYHASVRELSEEYIATTTTANAENLFRLKP